MSSMQPLLAVALLFSTTATAQTYTEVGSYSQLPPAPSWTTAPQNYSCVQACALVFGGDASEYRCSTVSGTRNNLARVNQHGSAQGCRTPRADTLVTPGTYSSGDWSAYVTDHSACYEPNFCWRADTVTTADAGGPYTAVEGIAITLSGSATDASAQSWDCEDDGNADSSDSTVSCIYPDQGSYTARFSASGMGTATDTATILVSNADPVIEAVDAPADTTPDVAIPLSVTATDVDALSYAWDFGDGGTATGAATTYSWSEPGTYTVRVVVDDSDGGIVTATHHVDVCEDVDSDGICDDVDPCTIGSPYDWDDDGYDDGCRGIDNIIHPSAHIPAGTKTADNVVIGEGVSLGSGNVLHDRVLLGKSVSLGNDNTLDEGIILWRHAELGDNTHIGADSILSRGASVGSNVTLGTGSIVGYNATVGDHVEVTDGLSLGTLAALGGTDSVEGAVVCPGPFVLARGSRIATEPSHVFTCTGKVTVGPNSVVGHGGNFGRNIRLRKDTVVGNHVVLQDGVRVGRSAQLASDVTVLDGTKVPPYAQLCDTDTAFVGPMPRRFSDPTCD